MKVGLAYFGIRDPKLIYDQITEFLNYGYTHICFLYSEEDFTYHRSVMRKIIENTAKQGLAIYVYPYGIGSVFEGQALSNYALKHPKEAQINNLGEIVSAVCFNQSNFRQYMYDWINEITALDIETVLWSIPYFATCTPSDLWSCRCTICQKMFRRKYSHTISTSLTENVKHFRQDSIFNVMSEMTGLVKKNKKRNALMVNFATVDDLKTDPKLPFLQKLMKMSAVDEISFQPYWERGTRPVQISKRYHFYSRYLLDFAQKNNKECQIWIKNFDITQGNETIVSEATHASYNEGIRNIFAWSAFGSRCSGQACDCPDKVFDLQTRAFSDCLDKEILNKMVENIQPQIQG